MMRLARIVCVASDLGACVRSLPRPCKNAQASSNASQIVRVLLNSNASGCSTMTQTPHARHASVRERGVLSGLKAQSLCDGGSITQRLRPPQSGVQLQFCDDPPIAHTLRCQTAADEGLSAVTRRSTHNALWCDQPVPLLSARLRMYCRCYLGLIISEHGSEALILLCQ